MPYSVKSLPSKHEVQGLVPLESMLKKKKKARQGAIYMESQGWGGRDRWSVLASWGHVGNLQV